MPLSFIPPRQVKIGDAAAFVGITPRTIRYYHQIGLLPEPERGSDGRRRYGYEEIIRLLWVFKMADAGIALDDIRDAFADSAPAGTDADEEADEEHVVAGVLDRLETTLVAQEAELQRQRTAVQRMRRLGSRMGLLSDFVTNRFEGLPANSLRQANLDNLLVIERIFGPLGAAVNASRYIAVATHPGLRQESDRIEAAEKALDDMVAVDDPRVAQVAAERHAFELSLHAFIESSGLAEEDDALFDSWDEMHRDAANQVVEVNKEAAQGSDGGQGSMSVSNVIRKMPANWSPARLRCIELAEELASRSSHAP